jgi:hypothetical protein
MTAAAFSSRLTRILEIGGTCVLFFMVASGLFYQFMGWKLGGVDLVIVSSLIGIYVNLFRSQLRQASDHIDELGKRLAALGNTRAVE